MELKLNTKEGLLKDEFDSNCTNMELKRCFSVSDSFSNNYSNCTNMELKPQ